MSNSAFTPTVLQDFREASVSQSGIVNTTAQTFSGHKLVKSTTAQQITAYGWSTQRGGASDNDGEIRLGIGSTSGFRLQQHDSGATTTYFDSRYDSVSSLVQFRTRTDGTPVVAFQYTGAGVSTFGPSSSDSRNLFVNGHFRTNGKITGAGVSVITGTNGPTAFLTENDVIKTSCTFLLVINTRSQSTPGRGATGLFAVSTHSGGTCNVLLISQSAIGGGHSLVAGAPGASQIGIVGNDNAGTWELQWQNNTVFDNYSLSYEIVGGSD
jgi:hypothetical protein